MAAGLTDGTGVPTPVGFGVTGEDYATHQIRSFRLSTDPPASSTSSPPSPPPPSVPGTFPPFSAPAQKPNLGHHNRSHPLPPRAPTSPRLPPPTGLPTPSPPRRPPPPTASYRAASAVTSRQADGRGYSILKAVITPSRIGTMLPTYRVSSATSWLCSRMKAVTPVSPSLSDSVAT